MSPKSEFRPSQLSRVAKCPGSWRAAFGVESVPSAVAEEGTLAHQVAESWLVQWDGKDMPDDWKPTKSHSWRSSAPKPVAVTEDMAYYVGQYVKYVRSFMSPKSKLFVEVRFDVCDGLAGTADAVIVDGDTVHVFDLKYGAGIGVDAVDNLQCSAYLQGVLNAIEADRLLVDKQNIDVADIKKARVHIVQPRKYDYPSVWELDDVWAFRLLGSCELEHILNQARAVDAPLVPGEHCRFCPVGDRCPAAAKETQELAEVAPQGLALEELTTERLLWFFHKSESVKCFLRATEAELYRRATSGEKVPGMKLVEKKSNRAWTDADAVGLLLSTYLEDEQIYERKLRSPAQVEAVLKKEAALKPKEVKELIDPMTSRVVTGVTLVSETDKRPEVLNVPVFEGVVE